MKFLSLALLSLTALVGAQNTVSDVVGGLDGLTGMFSGVVVGVEADAQDLGFFTSNIEEFTDVSALEFRRSTHTTLMIAYTEHHFCWAEA
jgi:hypothetical protein